LSWIVHLSDLHFGEEDKVAIAAAERFIIETRPALVVASGDLTAIGRRAELDAAFAWLKALATPVIATPGNHDTPYYELAPRLFFPFRSFHAAAEGVATDALHHHGMVLAPINTARGVQFRKNWALGAISRRQVAHACKLFADAVESEFCVVITHHPLVWPVSAPIKGSTRGGAYARARLIEAGARLFLSGHLHTAHIELIEASGGDHVATVSAPTLSIRQRGASAGFIAMELTDSALAIHVMEIAPSGEVTGALPVTMQR
jgi:3',5'-cyclic AMP phosphodiesterase CpdA